MGIVQGSGLSPTLYIVMATDLKSLSIINVLFKFADDTRFLVPENTDIDISVEFEHFRCWAKDNHIIIHHVVIILQKCLCPYVLCLSVTLTCTPYALPAWADFLVVIQ